MALTRKALKAMGLTEEQVESIVEMHLEVKNDLEEQIKTYKADAQKLPGVQKELDDLKAKGDDGWKQKHDNVKKEFDNYKASIVAKEARSAKEKAVRTYYESKGIKGNNLEIAMKGSNAEIDGVELDGENIKDTTALDGLVGGTFSGLVQKASFDWSSSVGGGGKDSADVNATMNSLIRNAVK